MLLPHDISAHDAQLKAQSIPPLVATKPAVVAPRKAKGPPIGFNFLQVPVQTFGSLHRKPPPPVPPGMQPELLAKSTSGLLGKAAKPPPRLKAFPIQEQLIHEQIEKQTGMGAKPRIKTCPSGGSALLSGYEHHAQTAGQVAPPAPPSLLTMHAQCVDSKSLGSAAMPPIKASPSSSPLCTTNHDRIAPMPKKPAPPLPPQLQLQPQHSAVVLDPEAWQPKRLTSEEQLQLPDVMLLTQTPLDISTQTAGQVLQSHDAEEEDAAVRQLEACSSAGGSANSEITNLPQVFDMAAGDTDDEAYCPTAPPDIQSPGSATGSGQAFYAQQTTGQAQPSQAVTQAAWQPPPPLLPTPPRTLSSDDESVPGWPWTGPEPVEVRHISFRGVGSAGSHTSAWTWTRNTWRTWWIWDATGGWSWTDPS